MMPLTLEELRDLAPGFVMNTLTPEESAQFDAAMRDPEMAAAIEPDLVAHRAAVQFLATEHAVTPPAALRARMLSRIASETRSNIAPAADDESASGSHEDLRIVTGGGGAAAVGPSAEEVQAVLRVSRGTTPTRAVHVPPQMVARPRSRAPWIIASLTGLAFAATAVFAVDLNTQVRSLRSELAVTNSVLKRNQARLADRDATVNILTEAGAKLVLVQLAPTEPKGPGIQLFWNVANGTAVVHASGLAQVAANRTYCLWMIRDGKPVPVKLFNPDPDGHRLLNNIELPKDMTGIAAFAVTEEPAEGSPQPTMTPFLVGAVAAPQSK